MALVSSVEALGQRAEPLVEGVDSADRRLANHK
jgi:hypothetical protein